MLPPGISPMKRSPSTSLYQRRNLTHSPQTPSLVLCLPLGSVASTRQVKSKPEWHLYSFSACLPWSNVSQAHWPWLPYFSSIYFSILPRLQFAHSKLWSGLWSRLLISLPASMLPAFRGFCRWQPEWFSKMQIWPDSLLFKSLQLLTAAAVVKVKLLFLSSGER